MAVNAGGQHAAGMANGTSTSPSPAPAEQEKLFDEILHLRDVVLAGQHAQFQLPPSAVEQLKQLQASLIVPPVTGVNAPNGAPVNGHAFATTTNLQRIPPHHPPSSFAPVGGLPGLGNAASSAGPSRAATSSKAGHVDLDPIFLQKSENLIREELRLKRERIERDLLVQLELRKAQSQPVVRDPLMEGASRFNVNLIYSTAMDQVKHISGLRKAASPASSSFDENDYYSSLVQSDWSSDASSAKRSDRATGAYADDNERVDGSAPQTKQKVTAAASAPTCDRNQNDVYTALAENLHGAEDDDDDYAPPDATAFDSSRMQTGGMDVQQATPDDDDSDYEPGEITAAESINPSPQHQPHHQHHSSANVPVIRNHLTHIAAPQPNRVSPLTTKDSNIELELVNGRPEVVHKPSYASHQMSRVSSASPTGHSGAGMPKKSKKPKKRKRDNEPQGRNKRRQKQAELDAPRSPVNPEPFQQEPYIKPEPMSPPPFMSDVPPAPQYGYGQPPPQVDLTGARPPPPPQYSYDLQPRYQYAQPEPQYVARVASPAQRPVQRDTQDLRRVASMQYAKRPSPPRGSLYSPVAPYRATSVVYGEPRTQTHQQDFRPRSPAVTQRYDDAFSSRAASPALMPPPPPPPARRIVQDQYGNQYYASDVSQSQSTIRASAVPESYERAPSRASYAQPPPSSNYYDRPDDRMPQPAHQSANGVEEPFEYTDADGYIVRGYRVRPAERSQAQPPRYSEAQTSPAYQEYRQYEQMPPPPAPQQTRQAAEPTSPTYDPYSSRSYTARPEQPAAAPQSYLRQASVAPVQYVPLRQGSVAPTQYAPQQTMPPPAPAPQRSMSVMPTYGYAGAQQQPQQQQQQQQQQQAAQPRYVDQYGNPVYPREVREVRQVDDYYHS